MPVYYCFHRVSWKANPSWPDGLEPDANPPGEILAEFGDFDEAVQWCDEHNATIPEEERGKLGGMYEFTSDP